MKEKGTIQDANVRIGEMFEREFKKACSEQKSLSELVCECLINAYSMGRNDEFKDNLRREINEHAERKK